MPKVPLKKQKPTTLGNWDRLEVSTLNSHPDEVSAEIPKCMAYKVKEQCCKERRLSINPRKTEVILYTILKKKVKYKEVVFNGKFIFKPRVE